MPFQIDEGALEVQIIDPQKNRKGKFPLETTAKGSNSYEYKTKSTTKSKTKAKTVSKSSSSASSSADSDGSYTYTTITNNNSSVKGDMHKEFETPSAGIWRIEIYPPLPSNHNNLTISPVEELHKLSLRERKIFSLLQQGKTNKEIAELTLVEVSTINSHLRNIYAKLGINSRREAVDFPLQSKEK